MSINTKELRALLDDAIDAANCANAVHNLDGHETAAAHAERRRERAREAVAIIAADALPDLLSLAEAVRELAPLIRTLDATMVTTYAVDDGIDHRPTATQRDAARRVLAILEGK